MSRCRFTALALTLSASLGVGVVSASADVVLDWNVIALETTAAAPFNPPLETRNLAIVHAAMFDAVNSITGESAAYLVRLRVPAGASAEAAAIAAAHMTLVKLYPEQESTLDASYKSSIERIPAGPRRAGGVRIGEAVALRILSTRASDGAMAAMKAEYLPGKKAGDWIPTPPASLPALDPGWGRVRPFVLRHGAQLRPEPPPALHSQRCARDFEEIKEIGSSTSGTRRQEETDLARFWIATASQNWNPVARQVSVAQGLTLSQNARAFALLNLAGADAFIAAWDAKFTYNQWRPVTAIRAAGDPSWTPLLITPPFPDYIAGHTTYAGAAEAVLEHLFGEDPGVVITMTSVTAPGVVETYTTFRDIADGVVNARVWGGIHWRTSSVQGRVVGMEVGRYVANHFAKRDSK
jgi:hypothetical protein